MDQLGFEPDLEGLSDLGLWHDQWNEQDANWLPVVDASNSEGAPSTGDPSAVLALKCPDRTSASTIPRRLRKMVGRIGPWPGAVRAALQAVCRPEDGAPAQESLSASTHPAYVVRFEGIALLEAERGWGPKACLIPRVDRRCHRTQPPVPRTCPGAVHRSVARASLGDMDDEWGEVLWTGQLRSSSWMQTARILPVNEPSCLPVTSKVSVR